MHLSNESLLPDIITQRAHYDHPQSFASVPKTSDLAGGFQDISYTDLNRGVANIVWLLKNTTSKDVETDESAGTVAYAGPNDLRYQMLLIAAMKTGHQIILPPPRTGLATQIDLLREAGCQYFAAPWPPTQAMRDILSACPLQYLVIPDVNELLHGRVVGEGYYLGDSSRAPETDEDADTKVFALLNPPGSSRLLPYRQNYFSTFARFKRLLEEGNPPEWSRLFTGKRFFASFPPYHVTALQALAWTVFLDGTMVLPPPSTSITAEVVEEVHLHGDVQTSFLPASVVKEVAKEEGGTDRITRGGRICTVGYTGSAAPLEMARATSSAA